MKTCCFTGHRILKITPELVQRLNNAIIELIGKGVTDFYNGGAIGFDAVCAETVIDLKSEYRSINLHMLLPCPADEQIKGWNSEQGSRYHKILEAADSIEVESEHYKQDCMKQRNERLVELADCCICYCSNPKSGTGQTVRMAENKGIPITNLAFQKFDLAKILEEIHLEEYAEFDEPPHYEPSPEFNERCRRGLTELLLTIVKIIKAICFKSILVYTK